jgi:hypothetical protein
VRDPAKPMTDDATASRSRSVKRTAWAIGLVALAIYVAFLLSGILQQ